MYTMNWWISGGITIPPFITDQLGQVPGSPSKVGPSGAMLWQVHVSERGEVAHAFAFQAGLKILFSRAVGPAPFFKLTVSVNEN